jgi:hypothetical protein
MHATFVIIDAAGALRPAVYRALDRIFENSLEPEALSDRPLVFPVLTRAICGPPATTNGRTIDATNFFRKNSETDPKSCFNSFTINHLAVSLDM